jgi:hypothetical protein
MEISFFFLWLCSPVSVQTRGGTDSSSKEFIKCVSIFTVSEVSSELQPSESINAGELSFTTGVTPVKNST